MKEWVHGIFGVTLCVALMGVILALGACTQEQKDAVHQKADAVVESAQKICKVGLDYDTVVTMLASADAVALTAWSVAKTVCNNYVMAHQSTALTSACPNGVAFNVCIKLAD
jgi:hypothetical protein